MSASASTETSSAEGSDGSGAGSSTTCSATASGSSSTHLGLGLFDDCSVAASGSTSSDGASGSASSTTCSAGGFGLDLLGRRLGLGLLDQRFCHGLAGLDLLDHLFRDRGRSCREGLLGQLEVGHRVNRLGAVRARHRLLALLHALEREREPPALAVDLEDAHVDGLALLHDLTRVLDVMGCELGDVHEALHAREDLDEGAERDDLRDAPLDDVVLAVVVEHLLPGVALRLLEPERDPLAVAVDVEHLHLHRLTDVEHLGRVVHVAPRQLRDVDQAVHPVEVDERAEVHDVGDLALDHVARAQPVEDRLPHLLALVLEDGAARKDDVVARAVQLDDLAAQLAAEELVEVLDASDVHERRGQEASDAEVEDEAALDDLDHLPVHGLAALGRAFDRLPGELEAGALLREDEPPVRVLLREDERVDLLAERDLVGRVDRPADRQLGDGNDAFGLVADVDEHLVLVDADDRAVHDLALVDLGKRSVVVRDQLPVGAGRPDTFFDCGGLLGGVVGHSSRGV